MTKRMKSYRYEPLHSDDADFVAYQRRSSSRAWRTVSAWSIPQSAARGGPDRSDADMKDVWSLAVFAGKVLCLAVFVARPEVRQHWRKSDACGSLDCKIARSRLPGCRLTLFAAASAADVRPCDAHPLFAHC